MSISLKKIYCVNLLCRNSWRMFPKAFWYLCSLSISEIFWADLICGHQSRWQDDLWSLVFVDWWGRHISIVLWGERGEHHVHKSCFVWLHYILQVLQLLCSWRASTLPQSVFTVSSPAPHHSHFAVQMQVHMIARTLANLWKKDVHSCC